MARIKPLFPKKRPPKAFDWLASHKETGQTFAEYRKTSRSKIANLYSTLRVVPIGPMSGAHEEVLRIIVEVLKPFFGLALTVDSTLSLDKVPANAKRVPFDDAKLQLLTTHLLETALPRYRRETDAAVLGITSVDLWAGPGWNFVFGQGSLTERVGVWSMARSGDPDADAERRHTCILRTLKTAAHETGHMFGIKHCTAYECGMNGSNNNFERDDQPVEFCPECQAKLWWTCDLDPVKRSAALSKVAQAHGLTALSTWWKRQEQLLIGN
jgi:archaemetzincin